MTSTSILIPNMRPINEYIRTAQTRFTEGLSCSQVVLSTFAPEFGLDLELALKVASPFGGGISHTGSICGAVTGGLMVLGLRYGATKGQDKQTKEKTYLIAQDFIKRFKKLNGSILCGALLNYDISDPVILQVARAKHVFDAICPKLIQEAIELVACMLDKHK